MASNESVYIPLPGQLQDPKITMVRADALSTDTVLLVLAVILLTILTLSRLIGYIIQGKGICCTLLGQPRSIILRLLKGYLGN
jgi:hypothetical protein